MSEYLGHDTKLFDFSGILMRATDKAVLVSDGVNEHWLPKQFTEDNGDGTFTIPEWLAIEKGIA